MSRVGKLPVPVPSGVSVTLEDGRCVVKGPKGSLEQDVHPDVRVSLDDGVLHGLTRALIANMVTGVTDGYRRTLEIQGTGYRAEVRGKNLVLTVGFSHPVYVQAPPGITYQVGLPAASYA